MRRLPDFLVIGANKAGSSSLVDYLRRHPGIFIPPDPYKEPCFFSDPAKRALGDGWYEGLFAGARPDQAWGEGSTTYSGWPYREAPFTLDPRAEIIARRPDVRLVYIVRHPVDRMFSQYRYTMRYGRTCSFEEAIEGSSLYWDYSRYDVQIEKWRQVLPDPRQLLVVLTEDMEAMKPTMFDAVLRHVGVEPYDLTAAGEVWSNPTGPHDRATRWIAPVRHAPVLGPILDRVPPRWRTAGRNLLIASPFGRRWKREMAVDPLTAEMRARLVEEFLPAVEAVEREVGRPLPHWRR